MYLGFHYHIGKNRFIHQWPNAIMNHNYILITNFTLKIEHAIPDTFLSCISSTYHPFKFGDIKLMSISPKDIMPSINAYHFNGIYLRMSLKSFQRINNNRFIIHIDKLFWNVLTHSLT